MSSLTDAQTATVLLSSGIASGLSALGALYMIISYLATPSIQKFSMKLVISMMYSCLLYSLANLLSYFNKISEICYIEGVIRVSSSLSSLIWAMAILHTAYKQFTDYTKDIEKTYKILLLFNIIISLTPPFIISIGQFTNRFVYFQITNLFCNAQPSQWALILVDIPRWVIMGLTILYTIRLMRVINEILPLKSTQQYSRIYVYSVVLVVTWLPGTLYRLYIYFIGPPSFVIVLMHVIPTRLAGFMNAIIYGKDYYLRSREEKSSDKEKKKHLLHGTKKPIQHISFQLNSELIK